MAYEHLVPGRLLLFTEISNCLNGVHLSYSFTRGRLGIRSAGRLERRRAAVSILKATTDAARVGAAALLGCGSLLLGWVLVGKIGVVCAEAGR